VSIAPWSFSRLKSFEQCPKQFYHMKIAKDYSEPETDAMRYGTEAHLAAEEFIRDGKPVPVKFAYMKDVLEALNRRRGNKITEIKMGLTQELEPCGFMSKDVWWRGIADLVITDGSTAWIVDYKTSKSAKYADKGQLELMALSTFKYFPNIKTINAALIFTKAKKFVKHKYTDDMIDSLWDKWLSKFRRMEVAYETDTWNAHPSGLCKRHCAVIECVYNGSN
jgi:CRISPR/Cas system-associated exonuclease Cas4 (RecB family)